MIKLIQLMASLILFISLPIIALDLYFGDDFLRKFMLQQSLQIMGTILAIYVATASSFLAILMSKEERDGKNIFTNTSKELRGNIKFIFVIFIGHFILLVVTPPKPSIPFDMVMLAIKGAQTTTFLLFIYILYELSSELFGLKEKVQKNKGNTE